MPLGGATTWRVPIKHFYLSPKMRRGYKRRRSRRKAGQRRKSFIDRDKLMAADQKAVGSAMVKLFAAVQNLPKEVQLLALASAFVLESEVLRFFTSDTYAAVVNLMKDEKTSSRRGLQFDAMKFHLETELCGEPEVHNGPANPFQAAAL